MLFFSLSNWYIQRQLGKRVNRCVDAGAWWVCKCQSESKHKAYKAAVVCLYKIRRMKSKQTEWQHRQRRKYPECNQCYTFSIESISICSQQQSNGWFSQNWFYAFVFVFRNRSTDSIFRMLSLFSLFHSLSSSPLRVFSAHFSLQFTFREAWTCLATQILCGFESLNGE